MQCYFSFRVKFYNRSAPIVSGGLPYGAEGTAQRRQGCFLRRLDKRYEKPQCTARLASGLLLPESSLHISLTPQKTTLPPLCLYNCMSGKT